MKVVKYILAVLFIFSTLGALKEGEIGAGLIFLILGIVLLPPISEQLKEKFKPWQTKGIRYVSYIVLFLTGSVLIGNNGMSNTSPTKDSISTKGEEKNNESLNTKQHIFNGNMEKVGETEEVRVIHHSLLKSWQHGNNNEDLGMDILISEEDIFEGQKYTSEILDIEQNYVIPDLKQKSSLLEEETEENPLPKIGEFDVMGEVMVNGKIEKYGSGGEIIGEDK